MQKPGWSVMFRAITRASGRGASSVPPIDADAPKVVWALDFQFDSTVDGRAVKIASMVDEHTRESLLHLVQQSITAERLVAELAKVFAVRGTPRVLRMGNGPEMISQALQRFCADRVGMVYIPTVLRRQVPINDDFGRPVITRRLSQRQHLELPVRPLTGR